MDHDLARHLQNAAEARYVSLTTFRRSGAPVPTPVWVARDGDELVVITLDGVGKTRRLAHSPAVELRPCDVRGTVADGAPTYVGTGRVVRDPEAVAQVKRAMSAKYPMARLGNGLESTLGRAFRRKPRAGIRITLAPPG